MKQIVPSIYSKSGIKLKKLFLTLTYLMLMVGYTIAQVGGVIAADQDICLGEVPADITSTAPASDDDGNTFEYLWMSTGFNNGDPTSWNPASGVNNGLDYEFVDQDGDPIYIFSTTYFARCARVAGSTGPFSIETNIIEVSVLSSPTTGINASATEGFSGVSIDLDAAYAGIGASYSWTIGGNFASSDQSFSETFSTPGNYEVALTVTRNGCSATTTQEIVISAPVIGAEIGDPCDCNDPSNFADPVSGGYYLHDLISVTSNADETWTVISAENIVDDNLSSVLGVELEETSSGKYFVDVYYNAEDSPFTWSITVESSSGLVLTIGKTLNGECSCPDSPLPVELVSFNATVSGKVVALNWETAAELNNSHFSIERSLDGNRFSSIGTIEGKGTVNSSSYYSFKDEKAIAGETYYRLKQVDYDGAYEYSPTVSVKITSDDIIISVYPNPVSKTATVRLGENIAPNTTLELLSTTGQVIRTFNVSESTSSFDIDMTDLAEGIYMLSVDNASRDQKAFYKLIKN